MGFIALEISMIKDGTFTADFVGIGAAKAASSWIYQCLKEHPDICASEPKETNFFILGNDKQGIEWYKRHFDHCTGEKVRGEFSPKYLAEDDAAEKIHAYFPNAKIIVCLRDPIERFASAAYYRAATGREDALDTRKMIAQENNVELERGLYYKHLKRFYGLFPAENILVMIYKDIKKDPVAFMQEVYRFLDVDDTFVPPSAHTRKNITSPKRVRLPWFHKVTRGLHQRIVKGPFKKFVPTLKRVGLHKLANVIRKINTRPEERIDPIKDKELYAETRQYLNEFYRKDIQALEKLTGKGLSSWR